MRLVSDLHDRRIDSRNVLVELTIGEYLSFARDIVRKNEFQRRRVSSSKTVYSLLLSDLERGCIIPPVVLALTSDLRGGSPSQDSFGSFVIENKDHLVILDGLQRTWTMIDLVSRLQSAGDERTLELVLSHIIRAEFYVGINRLGILYRMLTLNTGQSPMSLRHQIEILYLDYADSNIDGIELVKEADSRRISYINQYNFREIVEGFNSYLDRDELPLERADLLENIKSLEKLATENQRADIFTSFVASWHKFIVKLDELCGDAEVSEDFIQSIGTPFGNNVVQIFKKAQAISGYGAAVGKLKDFGLLRDGFSDIADRIDSIEIDNPVEFLDSMNRSLVWIKSNTKKIGNAQRSYFLFFFRGIFNRDDEGFMRPQVCADTALKKFQNQNM